MFKNKKLLLIVTILLIGILVFVLEKTKVINLYERKTPESVASTNEPKINLDPPTEEEIQAGNDQKQAIINQEEQQTNNDEISDGKREADVVIVDASQYDQEVEIRAFISNAVQNGTCTYTFKLNDTSFVRSMPAQADASTTPCITLTLARSDFNTSGNWNVTVRFESDSYMGEKSSVLEIK